MNEPSERPVHVSADSTLDSSTLCAALFAALVALPSRLRPCEAFSQVLVAFRRVHPALSCVIESPFDCAELQNAPSESQDPHSVRVSLGGDYNVVLIVRDTSQQLDLSGLSDAAHALADALRLALKLTRNDRELEEANREIDALRSQLAQNEKMASVGEISAGLMHDLSNPVTSIVAYSTYLRTQAEAHGTTEDLERANRLAEASHMILHLTRTLLTYARPSSPQPTPVAMQEVVRLALMFCGHTISEAGIEVVSDVPDDLVHIHAVREQLTQALVNLITNACRAMPSGGRLVIRGALTPARDEVVLSIQDSGPGIAPEHLPRVFEPFYTTYSAGGIGLGLSMVQQIAQWHDGRAWVESTPGHGTTFYLAIPRSPRSRRSDPAAG